MHLRTLRNSYKHLRNFPKTDLDLINGAQNSANAILVVHFRVANLQNDTDLYCGRLPFKLHRQAQ